MINQLTNTQTNNTITMTSQEIVEVINLHRQEVGNTTVLRHSDFMLKVVQVLGEETNEIFRSSYLAGNGEYKPNYTFPKREACLLAMSYSYDLQAKVYDRMTELEQLTVPKLPNFLDPAEAAIAWATEYKAKQEAETKLLEATQTIAIQTPKAEVYDILANKDTTYTIRDAAKLLTVRPIDLTTWLLTSGWMYGSSSSTYRPRASHADLHLVLKVNVHGTQTRVTSKGLMLLAKRMNKELQLNNT